MARVKKGEMLYEGKAKRLYATANPDELVMEFKDSLTAFDAVKKGTLSGKGAINNQISALIMGQLNAGGLETNFIRLLDETHSLVKRVQIVPLEVIVRYEAHGSLCRRYGIERRHGVIDPPLVEIGYKDDALHDPFLTDDIAALMGLATRDELAQHPLPGADHRREAERDLQPPGRQAARLQAGVRPLPAAEADGTPAGPGGSSSPTRSRPTPAAWSMPRPARSWTRTSSASTSATSARATASCWRQVQES